MIFTYDAMGNVLTKTDARGMVSTLTYDVSHRLASISYTSGVGTTLVYDGGTSPSPTDLGNLTKISDESGNTTFSYDVLGRVISKAVIINGKSFNVRYGYGTTGSSAGSLTSIAYPGGSTVNYGYGQDGKVSFVTVNPVNSNGAGVSATSFNIMSAIPINALNKVSGWIWGDGITNTKTFDSFGRISTFFLGNPAGIGVASGSQRTVSYDAAGKPTAFAHTNSVGPQTALDHSYGYDGRSRVINASIAGTQSGYDYDLSNNRTDLVVNGSDLVQTIATSNNRVVSAQAPGPVTQAFTYDASGNVQNDGTYSYTYSARGRMSSATTTGGAVAYLYNAKEQRVYKSGPTAVVPTGAAYFVYDESGHLLGEYDANGAPVYETIYIGDAPVALLKTTGTAASSNLTVTPYNVYTDHLGTPRVVTRSNDEAIVWRWDSSDAYGGSAANQNPSALGTFVYNQRFQGQIFDAETGNIQNWNREYSPRIGRYLESDPIGLRGGINTYSYVGGNPVSYVDPYGLFTLVGGVGGSFASGPGAEGSAGVYFNPGLFGQQADAGTFVSGGVGAGANVGLNAYGGVVFGDASNVNSPFVNVNISTGLGSLTIMLDPKTGDLGGISFGPAAKAGVSVTYTDTGKVGLRDLFNKSVPNACH